MRIFLPFKYTFLLTVSPGRPVRRGAAQEVRDLIGPGDLSLQLGRGGNGFEGKE